MNKRECVWLGGLFTEMKEIQNILFDLDGTLTDSMHGITNCFRYTLEKLNFPIPSEAELLTFVGPPLHRTFA